MRTLIRKKNVGQTFLNLLNGYHFLNKSSPLGIDPSLEGLLLRREMQKYCKILDICGNQNFAFPKMTNWRILILAIMAPDRKENLM